MAVVGLDKMCHDITFVIKIEVRSLCGSRTSLNTCRTQQASLLH